MIEDLREQPVDLETLMEDLYRNKEVEQPVIRSKVTMDKAFLKKRKKRKMAKESRKKNRV
jgi:hypothetical protein